MDNFNSIMTRREEVLPSLIRTQNRLHTQGLELLGDPVSTGRSEGHVCVVHLCDIVLQTLVLPSRAPEPRREGHTHRARRSAQVPEAADRAGLSSSSPMTIGLPSET